MPATSKTELRMLYAGVRERLRAEAGVGRVLEVESAEEVENVATTLASSA